MIDLYTYDIFRKNTATLKEISKDDSDCNNIKYMTESAETAVSFDKVKRIYVNALKLSEDNAASVDAVMQFPAGVFFIEFKNGKVNKQNVKDKMHDSLLLFCDIIGKNISYTRENISFILVYNIA